MAEQQPAKQDQITAMCEHRETWCAVERMKEEDWCRKNMRHYNHHLESHLFEDGGFVKEPRTNFAVNAPTHLERRHYPSQHLVAQWTTL
ncbi:uncharacterized protein [Littorina saxatilis]|uniref:Uncharacterized protein n=1 Tax=Littorina saxatilis TaxID=31220 RepID=A0AAN9BH06_9CAEN